MTTKGWVEEHLEFAMKADNLQEAIYRIRAVVTRLNISPLDMVEDPCVINPVLSRICERGTKSCGVYHKKK